MNRSDKNSKKKEERKQWKEEGEVNQKSKQIEKRKHLEIFPKHTGYAFNSESFALN